MDERGTVPALLAARAAQQPQRDALRVESLDSLTFGAWWRRSAALADALVGGGLGRGDRVVLHFGTRDWVDYAVAVCGVQLAGGVAVPSSDRLAPGQTRYVVEHSGAVLVLHGRRSPAPDTGVPAATVAHLIGAAPEGDRPPDDDRPPDGDGPPDGDDVARRLAAVRPGDLAQLLYTSGTTGRPKGVAATHANLTHGTAGAGRDPRRRPLGHSELFLHAFPIGTNAGQTMLLNALDARPTALVAPQFIAVRFARLVETHRVGTVFVVPSMAIELLTSGALDRHDLSSVQLLGSTAAPLPPWVAVRLAERLPGATIVNHYTSTEAAPAGVSMVFDPGRPGAVGRPAVGALAVRDEEGRTLPPGVTGEVWLRAPHARTYYRDEEATGRTFRAGWVRMGDLGHLDRHGYLHLVDREQDVVKSGADKVSTIGVEAAVHEHPDVAEAAVFGLPHPVLGTAVAVAVVPRPGADAPTLPQLRGFLRGRLAGHELPGELFVLDALPRNDGGKVLKTSLRERFGAAPATRQG